MFEKVDEMKKKIDEYRPFDADISRLFQEKLRIEWTYNSNAIEGNILTYGETAFFLREGLTSEGKPFKDYLEAKNHSEAIELLHDIVRRKRNISEGLIKEMHALLMKDIGFTYAKGADSRLIKKPLSAGQYKIRPNHVLTLSGKIHHYTSPLHVKDEMERLVKWFYESDDLHPVEKAAMFHYRFVVIHPFDDGNGRLARIFMNLILMQTGYPICIIKKEHRRQYFNAIEKADSKKNKTVFTRFIADELYETEKTVFDILEGVGLGLEPEGHIALSRDERYGLILENLSRIPLPISSLFKGLPIKRPTLKKDLKELVKAGKIKTKGKGKGTVYYV